MTDAEKYLKKRHSTEKRFRTYGLCAIGFSFVVLMFLLVSILWEGARGFFITQIALPIHYDALVIDPASPEAANYQSLVQGALRQTFPEAASRMEIRDLYALVSNSAAQTLREHFLANPALLGTTEKIWLPASDIADMYKKGRIDIKAPELSRPLRDRQLHWLQALEAKDAVRLVLNVNFFTKGDSREPEQAGFIGSMVGSILTLIVCISIAFPLGVMTAVYLEEFSRQNRLVDIIEVNINNLAAVPSIVFGLLGLALYLNFFNLPRSAALVGGMTLALMILPVIIITTRVSLKAVPDSIRQAARALGASPVQVVWHHVLPAALPGIMTGTILGMARAIGETAPLLMIGMVAFVADIPKNFTDPATAMPVQIYIWSASPELGFVEKTSAGILLLLILLGIMNSLAIIIRKRFEQRW